MLRLPSALGAAALALLLVACGPDRQPATTARETPAAAEAPAAPPPITDRTATLAAPPADSALLLRPGYAGPLRLNMKEALLLSQVPVARLRKTTRSLEGIEYPAYEYRPAGTPAAAPPLLLELVGSEEEGNRLWRVQVRDARYRTAEGIGVGSSYGEARRAYGVQTIERTEAGLVAVSERVGMTWVLDPAGLPAAGLLRKERIPPATRITGVILSY